MSLVVSSPFVSRFVSGRPWVPTVSGGSTFDSSGLVYEEVMWGILKQMEVELLLWERQPVRCGRRGALETNSWVQIISFPYFVTG